MFRVLIVLFLMFSMNSVFAGNVRSRIKAKSKKSKTEFSFTYQSVWYSKLSKKQKKVYLNTLQQLVVNLSKADKNSAEFKQLQDLFIEKAYAAISNGFVYNSNADRPSKRATKEAYGDFYRDCPSGQTLCALYMGLNSSGKAMCSNDSTPGCVGETGLLNQKISECEGDSSSRCSTLRNTLKDGTKGVTKYCENSRRKSKGYCLKAMEQLKKAKIPDSPLDESGVPEGANCSDVSNRVKKAQLEKMDEATRKEVPESNGSFWGNMVRAASKSCPGADIGTLRKKLGSCSLPRTQGIKKRKMVKKGEENFQACVANVLKNKTARIRSINANGDWSSSKKRKEREKINDLYAKRVAGMEKNGCNWEYDSTLNYTDLKEYNGENLNRIYDKIKAKKSLSTAEKGLFSRATGMTVDGFKAAFCSTSNHNAFKTRLGQKVGYEPRVVGAVESQSPESNYQLFLGQINAARTKMSACSKRVKKPEQENDCDFHPVTGSFNISKVDKKGPYVLEKDGKCLMVTEMRKEPVTSSGRNRDGTRKSSMEYSFLASVPGKEDKILVMTPGELSRAFKVKTFACKSKTNLNITGCETNPEKVDSFENMSAECKEVYENYNGEGSTVSE